MGPFIGIDGVGFYGFGINTRGEFVIVTDDYIFVPVHLSRSRSRSRSSSFMLRIFGLYFFWFMNLCLCDIVENRYLLIFILVLRFRNILAQVPSFDFQYVRFNFLLATYPTHTQTDSEI